MMNELDLKSLWKELDDYVLELDKESKSLQEVWVKIAQIKSKNEAEAVELVDNIVSFNVLLMINFIYQVNEEP